MQTRPLGRSGIAVSALSLGSWLTFELMDEASGLDVMAAAIDAGISFLDDARYDDRTGQAPLATGYSEVVFGGLLRKGGWPRDRLVIANKLWFEFYPQQSIAEELEGSLSRLGLDYLDVMYCAPPGEALPLDELVGRMTELVGTGKLRGWGVLNWPAAQIEAAHALASAHGGVPPCAAQLPYSLLRRAPVESAAMRRACAATGVAVVASACLAGGLLTGKYDGGALPAGARLGAGDLARLDATAWRANADRFAAEASALGTTRARLALAFCLVHPQVCSVLFGASRAQQVADNIGALDLAQRLDAAALERLAQIFPAAPERRDG